MKILSSALDCILLFSALYFLLLPNISIIHAVDSPMAKTTLTQTILPVRFIYLNDKGEIVRIYNNVSSTSSAYILNFYQNPDNKEIETTQELVNKYISLVENVSFENDGYIDIASLKTKNSTINQPHIKIIATPYSLEEIHTYI